MTSYVCFQFTQAMYYTVGHKKTRHVYFCDNSGKY